MDRGLNVSSETVGDPGQYERQVEEVQVGINRLGHPLCRLRKETVAPLVLSHGLRARQPARPVSRPLW